MSLIDFEQVAKYPYRQPVVIPVVELIVSSRDACIPFLTDHVTCHDLMPK